MNKDQKGFIVYGDTKSLADELSDEQLGQLFRGMLDYFVSGKAPKFSGVLKFAFIPIKQQMDRDQQKYDAKCEKNRSNIKKYWDNVKTNTNVYDGIRTYTTATNTNTKTKTNTKTDTDTKTTTNTNTDTNVGGGGSAHGDDDFNIWKQLDPEKVDRIYEAYPNSGGILIDEVYEEVKRSRRHVKDAVAYILGYAKKVNWDDNADHA